MIVNPIPGYKASGIARKLLSGKGLPIEGWDTIAAIAIALETGRRCFDPSAKRSLAQ
jgi:hypothetical protein